MSFGLAIGFADQFGFLLSLDAVLSFARFRRCCRLSLVRALLGESPEFSDAEPAGADDADWMGFDRPAAFLAGEVTVAGFFAGRRPKRTAFPMTAFLLTPLPT